MLVFHCVRNGCTALA